jgi:hypothetical protein
LTDSALDQTRGMMAADATGATRRSFCHDLMPSNCWSYKLYSAA